MRLDSNAAFVQLRVELRSGRYVQHMDMALDTGASYVLIPTDVAEDLGFDLAAAERHIMMTTASSVESAPLITIGRNEALGPSAARIDTVCFDLPEGSSVKGLLGLSFLKHFDVDVHFRQGVLNIRQAKESI